MASVTSIVPVRKAADPLRAALGEAISAEQAGRRELEEHHIALARARDLVAAAERKVEAARGQVARERDLQTERVAQASRQGTAPPSAGAMRAARAAEQDCVDEMESAVAALKRLEGRDLESLLTKLRWLRNRTIAARNSVLRPVAEDLLARARQLRRDATIVESTVVALVRNEGDTELPDFPEGVDHLLAQQQRLAPLADLEKQGGDFYLGRRVSDQDRTTAERTAQQFRAWAARLLVDADAEAP